MTSSNGNISTWLALCAGNSPVTGEFPHKGQWRGALMFSLICAWTNGWANNRYAGDLRRPRAHYDVTVMYIVDSIGDDGLVTQGKDQRSGLPSHRASNAELFSILFAWLSPWTVELPVIWDAIPILWCHSNARQILFNWNADIDERPGPVIARKLARDGRVWTSLICF